MEKKLRERKLRVRLWRAQQLGLFQTVRSPVLDARIPANFRDPEGQWYGFSLRARVIVYNKAKVKPEEISTYASLAEPKWKGRICVRSGTHVYNLSLMGALIERGDLPTRLADGTGYRLTLYPALEQFPGASQEVDTARINAFLEARIREQPEQYLWVHRRFKTRPPGESGVY